MCGRFTLATPAEIVAEFFELAVLPELTERYNIAPTQGAPVVRADADGGERSLAELHWGLIPGWAKDASIGARMINARSETLSEKPSFRAAFKRRRCLIAADGFYEWQKLEKRKVPHRLCMKDDGVFGMAGLWERWKSPDGGAVESCTIVTTTPNAVAKKVHDRMPVILPRERFEEWLDPGNEDVERLQKLLRAYPATKMRAYAVSTRVNSPRNDDAACIALAGESEGLLFREDGE